MANIGPYPSNPKVVRRAAPARKQVRPRVLPKVTVKKPPIAKKPPVITKKPPVVKKPPVTSKPLPTVPSPSLTGIRSYDDLSKQASSEVDAELSGQISPLQSQLGSTQSREAAAQAELEKMFNELQPGITDAMHLVSDRYDQTLSAEQNLFSAAGQKLNQIKQDAASEAQKMAQTVGGPVAVDKFTGAVDPSIGAFGAEAAGSMLHSMGLASAGVTEQADWAGKVFPLIRTEKEMGTRAGYETQIKELQDHISQLQGTRTGAINTKLNDMLAKEREYALQKAQQKLEQLKSNRDWQATVHTLKNDDARLSLAGYSAQTTRNLGLAKLKLDAKKLSQKEQNDAAKFGLSKLEYARKLAQGEEGLAIQRARVKVAQQKNSIQMAKALTNPSALKPLTLTHKVAIPPQQMGAVITGKMKDAWYDKKTQKWYRYVKETITSAEWSRRHAGGVPVTDPKQLYQILKNSGMAPAIARQATIKALHKDPTPGKKKK